MVKIENKNENFLKNILNKKPYSYFVIIGIIIVILVFGFFSFKYFKSNVFSSFHVSGANFDLAIKKIPYNVKSIDLTFNYDIDPNSINNEILKINPQVSGVVKLKNSNTISFELGDKLEIGNDYSLVLSKNLKSKNGKNLNNDLLYILKATPGASVLKVLPEEKMENLSSNISVFFSIPMVNLSNLDLKDELPCPIEISPKVLGKCSWTTSSVLEFIPAINFNGSTKYDLKIVNKPGLNYELENEVETSFETPKLALNIPKTFIPKNNLVLDFNYPVSLTELENSFGIEGFSGVLIEKNKNSDLSFVIKPALGEFKYATDYKLLVKNQIKPLYGNISFDGIGEYSISSSSLVSDIFAYQNVYSSTGELIDTNEIIFGENEYNYKFLPNKNVFFKIYFNEEIDLDKNLFSFQDSKGNKIDFDLKYSKFEDENKKIVEDKKIIDLTLKGTLENDTDYKLIISKIANKNLLNDLVYEYKTSKKLEIVRTKTIDYSKTCIYTNNKLPCSEWGECNESIKNSISLSNSGILKSVFPSEENSMNWEDYNKLTELNFEEQNKFLAEKGYCENAGSGEYLYVLNTRLRPNFTYNLEIKSLEDVYSNVLEKEFSKEIKTGNLKETDKYVYSSFPTFSNVYPKNAPVVLIFQTINSDEIYVEICEMGESEYIDYLANRYSVENYKPKCVGNSAKNLKTKNNYWNLTNNKFDLYKDILGKNDSKDYLLVSAYPKKDSKINFSKNIIIRTNLSLFLEKAANKSILFATDIGKNLEVSDLNLEFFDFSGKKVEVNYVYNKAKKAYEIDNDLEGINYITAKNKNLSGIITGDDYFSNYDFKYISGMDSSIKNYLYVYTDRPIYRPGDEVFIKGILREFSFDGFKKSKFTSGTLKIQAEDYSLYREIEVKLDKNSNFTGSFIIPSDSTLGAFSFQFEPKLENADGDFYDYKNYVYTNSYFYIEEYKKPTFKVDITTDKEDFSLGQKTKITVSPKYYFGGKMVNTDGIYNILSQNHFFDAKEYADYQFGENSNYYDCLYWGYCEYGDYLEDSGEFKISPDGEFNFEYEFPKTSSGEKIYTFSFDVTDPDTKKTVSNSISKILHSTDGYVGLKTSYYNTKKSGVEMDLVFLDYDAKTLPYKTAKVNVIKRNWKEVKKLGVDGVFYSDYSLEEKKEKSFSLIGDKDGKVSYNLKTASSGEYEIKVTYTGADGNSYVTSSIVYVDDNEYINWRNSNNTVTDLSSEKTTYKLGETASFILKSPVNNGKAIIILEKDDGIIDYFVHDIKSYSDKIDIKITDKHYPNLYIKAFLIGNQEGNPLPVYKRALSIVKVLTDYKNLNISIKTDKENYNPGDKVVFNIEVLDSAGKPVKDANGTLSVVDESLLALKGNPKKNPYSFFYDMKRYLGVVSYASLKYLVEKLEVKDVTGGEKGGSGEGVKGGEAKKSRGNFEDTAFWIGDFTTDANGKTTITLDTLPDNLTTWVIEAVVNTSEDNKIGVAYETIMTSKEVMVEDNLPRFINAGDFITLSPVIYNRTGKDDNFKVSISSSLGTLESQTKNVFIKSGKSSKVTFNLTMVESNLLKGNDLSKITISANNSNNSKTDSITKYIRVLPLNTKEQVSTIGKTTDVSYEEKISLGDIVKNDSVLKINYAGTLFTYLLDGVDYNNNFPYGSSENKTSALMPNIYIKKLYDVSGIPFDLKNKMVKKYIDSETGYKEINLDEVVKDFLIEIKKFQNLDGGFAYWNDGDFKLSDVDLTTYILSSLSEIKSLGYNVDKNILDNGSRYLKKEFYDKKVCDDNNYENCLNLETKVKILYSLLAIDSNDYEVYKMYKLLDFSGNNSLFEAEILSNIANIKDLTTKEKEDSLNKAKSLIDKILSNNLVYNPRGAYVIGFDDKLYATTTLLNIISNLGLEKFKDIEYITDNMIRFIVSSKTNSSFGSTFDNSSVIKSLSNYLGKSKELTNTNYFARINLNSEEIETKKINKDNIFENFSKEIPLKSIKNENIFSVSKDGSGTLYYDLNLTYYVSAKEAKERDEGFYVETKYYDYNEYKKIYTLKEEEYNKYLSGEIKYEDLVYKKEVIEYLKPILYGNVGDLVLVYNKIITNEPRNQVAIESFIPSGSEIVNTNLETESKTVKNIGSNVGVDREEMRDDRYFGWLESLNTGIYNVSYTIRLTHTGRFSVSPSKVSEFYNEEVFGRSKGFEFFIK